jgi:hypothetical protein
MAAVEKEKNDPVIKTEQIPPCGEQTKSDCFSFVFWFFFLSARSSRTINQLSKN